jgi:tetratricopeptide (TPR) repeat protein
MAFARLVPCPRLPTCALLSLALLVTVLANAPLAGAEDPPTRGDSEALPDIPLPEIPKLEPIERPPPKADAVAGLTARLDELMNTRIDDPLAAPSFGFLLDDLDDGMVPAIVQRMAELKEQIDGAAAEKLLERGRQAGRKALKKAKGSDDGDWLVFMLSLGEDDSDVWRDAVKLYGMLRMLEAIGTTPAVRQMIESYSHFGELVRIDLQRAFGRLEHKAVPALIEARQHDARKVRTWAARQLDMLGRAIPGEAVSTTDPQILADVLRAFGRTRELDATRVILSFTSSDRAQLREAAREAIGAIGEPATWHLKDTYQNLTGEKAPRGWDWKQTARELFRIHDRAHLAPVYAAMAEGKHALADKRYQAAVTAFDRVLAHAPLFPGRGEMAPAYLGRAEELVSEGKDEEAMVLLRKGRRLLPDDADVRPLEATLTYLEAKALVAAGTPDRFLIEKAIELSPDARTHALRDEVERAAEARQGETKKIGAAIGVGLVAFVLLILLARVGRPKKASPSVPAPDVPASDGPASDASDVEPSADPPRDIPADGSGVDGAGRVAVEAAFDETPTMPRPPDEPSG